MTGADFHAAALERLSKPQELVSVDELDRFAERTFSADWEGRALEILESIVGPDLLSYADPAKATKFATTVLSMAALAAVEGNTSFLKGAANLMRLQARAHGVEIARGAEARFADKLGSFMDIAKTLLPLFL